MLSFFNIDFKNNTMVAVRLTRKLIKYQSLYLYSRIMEFFLKSKNKLEILSFPK